MFDFGYGLEKSIKIELIKEILSHVYSSDLLNVHGFLFYDNFLWGLMAGNYTQNPVKIDESDLSSYSGITSNENIGNNQIIFAKNYIWFPKNEFLNIRRINPTTLATTDYDGTGVTATQLTQGGMIYDSGTDSIFVEMNDGFAIMDISDVDNPVFTYHDVKSHAAEFVWSFMHSICSDGTYIYMSYKAALFADPDANNTVLKIKASDPAFGGTEGWVFGACASMKGYGVYTDDCVYKDNYLYYANDPAIGYHPYLIKINASDLTEHSKVQLNNTIGIGCYGVWEHEGFLFTVISTSPGKIKIYDLNLNLLYSYTFKTGYDSPNEIVFSDTNTMFVTFWGDTALKIMKLHLNYL